MAAAHPTTNNTPVEDTAVASEPRLFVGQIPPTYKDTDLRPLFETYGAVKQVHIMCGHDGRSKGCAMVTFERWADAEAAIETHSGKTVLPGGTNRPLTVSFAHPKRVGIGAVQQDQGIAPRKLFVGQIPVTVGPSELRALFEPCGEIVSMNLLKRVGEPTHRGCGFLEFAKWAHCEAAIEQHHGKTTLAGNRMPLVVKFADARKPRPGEMMGGGPGGGPGGPGGGHAGPPNQLTGSKRGGGDMPWPVDSKRPSLQGPGGMRGGPPMGGPGGMEGGYGHPHNPQTAIAAMNLGLNLMALGGPALAQQLANGQGLDPQQAANLTMMAAQNAAMAAGGAGGYQNAYGAPGAMGAPGGGPGTMGGAARPKGPPGPGGAAMMDPSVQGGMGVGGYGMGGGMDPNAAAAYAAQMAAAGGMAGGMPGGGYGAHGAGAAHYGQHQGGMGGVLPPPTPVVTSNNRLGKGLSPDNRELRWKLFIGQVPPEASQYDLWNLFSGFGEICELHVLTKPDGGSRGCAFLTFAHQTSAQQAIQMLDMHPMGNKHIRVKYADQRVQR